MGASSASHPLNVMCNKGWKWRVVPGELEEHFPGIVFKLTQSCNTVSNVQKGSSEFECAMLMASLVSQTGCSIDEAKAQVQATQPKCADYLDCIVDLIKNYSGGDGFPLLKFLQAFQSKYAAAVNVGESFMRTLVSQEFKHESSTCPFSKIALLATQLTSTKVQDSIATLLKKSDVVAVSKLDNLVQVESLLASAWNLLAASDLMTMEGFSIFGTYCTRMVLHVLKKENLGREPLGHANLDAITLLFAQAVQDNSSSSQASPAAAPAAAASGSTALVSLADSTDAAQVTMKKLKLKIGSRYVQKDDKKDRVSIYTLDSVDEQQHLVFKHKSFLLI